jgi:hypothetical protein
VMMSPHPGPSRILLKLRIESCSHEDSIAWPRPRCSCRTSRLRPVRGIRDRGRISLQPCRSTFKARTFDLSKNDGMGRSKTWTTAQCRWWALWTVVRFESVPIVPEIVLSTGYHGWRWRDTVKTVRFGKFLLSECVLGPVSICN